MCSHHLSFHWPFKRSVETRDWSTTPYRRLCSIDPGITDLCIRFELRKLNDKGKEDVITEVSDILDLTDGAKKTNTWKNQEVVHIYNRLTKLLDMYLDLFLSSHIIVVESQPIKGRNLGVLVAVTRVTQHIFTYLSLRLSYSTLLPLIIEVDPKLKYVNNNYPVNQIDENGKKVKIKKPAKKKHSTALALELLEQRGDEVGLNKIKSAKAKHKDDMADTIMQLEGVLVSLNWPSDQAFLLRPTWSTLREGKKTK